MHIHVFMMCIELISMKIGFLKVAPKIIGDSVAQCH